MCLDLILLPLQNPNKHAFTPEEINDTDDTGKTLVIPKIIHQTYKTENVLERWKAGQQACIDLHPDYKYILWTDEMSQKFIAENYPWFLDTWKSYKYPIERADAIRYFVLAHYGGVYIDLDDGCKRRLDPLMSVPAFARSTSPSGISNDVLGSVPGHPFFLKAIHNLKKYNRSWILPYITIMFSTGPLYLSVILEKYFREKTNDDPTVKILLQSDYKGHPNSFFQISRGSSWHKDDAHFIKTLGRHIPLAVFAGFMTAGLIFLMEWYIYQWCIHTNFSRIFRNTREWTWSKLGYRYGRPRKDSNLPTALISSKDESMV